MRYLLVFVLLICPRKIMDQTTEYRKGEEPQPTSYYPNWTIDVISDIKTVRVSNVSASASERDILEFFSFSGNVQYIDMQRETETTQLAYVTFNDSQGADTSLLLTGATIADRPVLITPVENYQLPPNAPPLNPEPRQAMSGSAVEKAEDVVSTMLAKGYVLGKDALKKAKSFDERHHLTLNASATVSSIDRKIGFSEKLSMGAVVVNDKVREIDEKFHLSERTKTAFENAGSAAMSNRYVSTGANWVTNALSAVSKAAEDVGSMTKEKVEKSEEKQRGLLAHEFRDDGDFDESLNVPNSPRDNSKLV